MSYIYKCNIPDAHEIAQGFNEPRPPPRTLIKTIDLTTALDMVNLCF